MTPEQLVAVRKRAPRLTLCAVVALVSWTAVACADSPAGSEPPSPDSSLGPPSATKSRGGESRRGPAGPDDGVLKKARRYVALPDESKHVTGHAVDIGPTDADDWLIRKGYRYGLCQTVVHEMWHFELTIEPGTRCPAPE